MDIIDKDRMDEEQLEWLRDRIKGRAFLAWYASLHRLEIR